MYKEFCISIGLSEEAAQICEGFSFTNSELEQLYAELNEDAEQFLLKANAEKSPYARLLALFTHFAIFAKEKYEKLLFPMHIFYDTFADIALWEREHYANTGEHGIFETEWLAKHVCLKVFRLGAVQFEPAEELPDELPESAKGLAAYYVHVPKGADISKQAVQKSLKQALEFFKTDKAVFLCHSWLLSPVLAELLPENSRILQFAANFNILSLDFESHQAEERIFGKILNNPLEYADETSLQAAAKKYLLSGKDIPSAEGYFIIG